MHFNASLKSEWFFLNIYHSVEIVYNITIAGIEIFHNSVNNEGNSMLYSFLPHDFSVVRRASQISRELREIAKINGTNLV